MLIGPTRPLVSGETVPVTVRLNDGTVRTISLVVRTDEPR